MACFPIAYDHLSSRMYCYSKGWAMNQGRQYDRAGVTQTWLKSYFSTQAYVACECDLAATAFWLTIDVTSNGRRA